MLERKVKSQTFIGKYHKQLTCLEKLILKNIRDDKQLNDSAITDETVALMKTTKLKLVVATYGV